MYEVQYEVVFVSAMGARENRFVHITRTPKLTKCYAIQFGQNAQGELGLGDSLERRKPAFSEACRGKDIVQVTAGNEHTAVLTNTGEVCSGIPVGVARVSVTGQGEGVVLLPPGSPRVGHRLRLSLQYCS